MIARIREWVGAQDWTDGAVLRRTTFAALAALFVFLVVEIMVLGPPNIGEEIVMVEETYERTVPVEVTVEKTVEVDAARITENKRAEEAERDANQPVGER